MNQSYYIYVNYIYTWYHLKFPEPECKTWFGMFLESFEDATLIVLIIAAVVSFVVGLIEDPAKG